MNFEKSLNGKILLFFFCCISSTSFFISINLNGRLTLKLRGKFLYYCINIIAFPIYDYAIVSQDSQFFDYPKNLD